MLAYIYFEEVDCSSLPFFGGVSLGSLLFSVVLAIPG